MRVGEDVNPGKEACFADEDVGKPLYVSLRLSPLMVCHAFRSSRGVGDPRPKVKSFGI